MIIQICVGSSCHLKGSPEIVELLTQAVKEHKLEDEITLAGSFCIGKCNRVGVTVQVDDVIHTGINRENFKEFLWYSNLSRVRHDHCFGSIRGYIACTFTLQLPDTLTLQR